MKIIIYVEGPSDRDSLGAMLASLITQAAQGGCLIQFIPTEGKRPSLTKVPLRAVNILRNDREARVFALPDLYPPNIVHPHASYGQLKQALIDGFRNECNRLKVDPEALLRRFHVHCLKHDLEALLLAAEEQLKRRLGLQTFPPKIRWSKPVEDQNHQRPPKRIIEELFRYTKARYIDTVDAPLILEGVDPFNIASKCPQCFGPFLNDLTKLAGIS